MSFSYTLANKKKHTFPHAAEIENFTGTLRRFRTRLNANYEGMTDEEAGAEELDTIFSFVEALLGTEGEHIDAFDKVPTAEIQTWFEKFMGGLDPKASSR